MRRSKSGHRDMGRRHSKKEAEIGGIRQQAEKPQALLERPEAEEAGRALLWGILERQAP